MSKRQRVERVTQSAAISIRKAAERAGVEVHVVRYCVEVGLIAEDLTEQNMAELRRVRRLRTLGINLPGVEVILRMRHRIQELQAEVIRLERLTRS